jgi:ubiquinone/menaquinone biosynthesis C-methylase UbiE
MVRRKIESLKTILVAPFEAAVFLRIRAKKAGVRKGDSLRFFNADAVDYDSTFEHTTKNTHPIVLAELEKISSSSILDVSCGTGTILSKISTNVKKAGLDLSPKMIYWAKQKLGGSADLVVGDSEMLPYANGSFDVVTCTLAFHHFGQPEIVVNEMHRVLRKGGRVIICDMYEPISWRRLLANIFMLAFSGSGDLHSYSEKEIKWLLNRVGFRPTVWKKEEKRFIATGVRN